MKVVTSCSGRFHIFDQAAQLYRHGILGRLISDYPSWKSEQWGIPSDKSCFLMMNGILNRAIRKSWKYIRSKEVQENLNRMIHKTFSKRLASHVPADTDIFIGLSAFCLESLDKIRANGIVTIVDHGSFHQQSEKYMLMEEASRIGVHTDELPPEWIIHREQQEFDKADYVFTLSNMARNSVIENGISETKVKVNHCGVDNSIFYRGDIDIHRKSIFRVIYCGGFSLGKGVYHLLKAFNELDLPDSELLIIGSYNENSEIFITIKKYLDDKVKFTGPVPQRALRNHYITGDVFVMPSIVDGFGMVLPQAMSCGLPAITTSTTGSSEIIRNGVDGYVVPASSSDVIKERLEYLYSNRDRCLEMGLAASDSIATHHTWNDYGDRLKEILQNMI